MMEYNVNAVLGHSISLELVMQLTELIREDLIKIDLEAKDKWEAIEELVDQLISVHELSLMDRGEVVQAVFAREKSMSTGLET